MRPPNSDTSGIVESSAHGLPKPAWLKRKRAYEDRLEKGHPIPDNDNDNDPRAARAAELVELRYLERAFKILECSSWICRDRLCPKCGVERLRDHRGLVRRVRRKMKRAVLVIFSVYTRVLSAAALELAYERLRTAMRGVQRCNEVGGFQVCIRRVSGFVWRSVLRSAGPLNLSGLHTSKATPMAHRIEDLRLRLTGPRPNRVVVDGIERNAIWHTTAAEIAPHLFAEFVFDAGSDVIAEAIDGLGVAPVDAFPIALRQTYEAAPAEAKTLPINGLPDKLWALAGEVPYVTAHALFATRFFMNAANGTTSPAVIFGVPRRTEVFCYPVDTGNLDIVQDMANAIAKFSFGYFRETRDAISPHVYWCDRDGRISLLVDTLQGQSFPEPLFAYVAKSVAGSA